MKIILISLKVEYEGLLSGKLMFTENKTDFEKLISRIKAKLQNLCENLFS